MRACPKKAEGACLSALTQKKGQLTSVEKDAILHHGSAWGCDMCQEGCPYTKHAREAGTLYTPLECFYRAPISRLTKATLNELSDDEFKSRAYAWRGKETVLRNLEILEGEPLC